MLSATFFLDASTSAENAMTSISSNVETAPMDVFSLTSVFKYSLLFTFVFAVIFVAVLVIEGCDKTVDAKFSDAEEESEMNGERRERFVSQSAKKFNRYRLEALRKAIYSI